MITIIGATGNVGRKVAHALLDDGHPVRVLGRTFDSLEVFSLRGADVRQCDIADSSALLRALAGSESVFAMVPSDPTSRSYAAQQHNLGQSISTALAQNSVSTVVALSSLGADRVDAPGVIGALHLQERRLRALRDTRVMALRPVSFFENLSAAVDHIREHGGHVDSVLPDLLIPMIATQDVADAAVDALTDRTWTGFHIKDLLGERDLSYNEATRILGERMGVPAATYVQLSDGDMETTLGEMGMSEEYCRQYVEMTRAFNSGEITDPIRRTNANTTSTSFEDYAGSLFDAELTS